MSLDLKKLEKARELAKGVTQARCPACAEGGGDKKGEHLRIYPDGRYGCCVHPKDGEHRKRIFALAGERERRPLTVKVAMAGKPAEPARSVRQELAGALRTLRTGNSESVSPDEGAEGDFRTLRTPISKSRAYGREEDHTHMCKDLGKGVLSVLDTLAGEVDSETAVPSVPGSVETAALPGFGSFGTLGTGDSELRAGAREKSTHRSGEKLKDSESAVPSVPSAGAAEPPPTAGQRLPFLTAAGTLSIPFDSPERYHWWKGGQSVRQTREELEERKDLADSPF